MNATLRNITAILTLFFASGYCTAPCWSAPQADPAAALESAPLPPEVWQSPKAAEVKSQAMAWLKSRNADKSILAKAEAIWANLPGNASDDDLLLRLAKTFALVEPNAQKLLVLCMEPRTQRTASHQEWLREKTTPKWMAANLRLFYAAWLVRESLYDEAADQLTDIATADVAAPASLLFHQSIVYHALLNKEKGLKSIDSLLQGGESVPRRYIVLAMLMQDDLNGLQADTLDFIARRMADIRRRLDLGRAGPKVLKAEDEVVAMLNKIIKKLEEEQDKQQQQQQQQQGSNAGQPKNPAQQSQLRNGESKGEVTKKNIGSKSGWGDLPQKQREEMTQQIGREFPPHYREAIEQYFRRLAAEKDDD
jgi:hypothetical protein